MKIFRCDQIRQIDDYTIRNEPVVSTDLMERAAQKLHEWISQHYDNGRSVMIFAGPGNNGGDGLALARMLSLDGYKTSVWFAGSPANTSGDWKINRNRLEGIPGLTFNIVDSAENIHGIEKGTIIIDALFGSGLTRPVKGLVADVISKINSSRCTVISVDMPSGLFGEDNAGNDPEAIVMATHTLTFQFPKLSFMFPENEKYTGQWHVLPIGLHEKIIESTETPYSLLARGMIKPLIRQRNKFDHKGSFGHGLLAGGSYGKMGAVILGARAALRTGIGLITCHIPSGGNLIMQCSVPEAMLSMDSAEKSISEINVNFAFNAAGVGPGMGTEKQTQDALHEFIRKCRRNLVLDADALNILSENREWLKELPAGTVLTPHPKEFERLAGKTVNSYERLSRQITFSMEYGCIVVLKGAHTSISDPAGKVAFNLTGNPGMATAGSGDTLTGIILSLLAQGYDPGEAAKTGVCIHGLAGDIAAGMASEESLVASDIIDSIGAAFNRIREQ